MYLILKAALSGVLIAIISEAARRYPGFGGLIASLPLISLMAIIWLWKDTGGDVRKSRPTHGQRSGMSYQACPFFSSCRPCLSGR